MSGFLSEGRPIRTLREILQRLKETYCGSIGYEVQAASICTQPGMFISLTPVTLLRSTCTSQIVRCATGFVSASRPQIR